jgi:hypothetical protein
MNLCICIYIYIYTYICVCVCVCVIVPLLFYPTLLYTVILGVRRFSCA